MPLYEFLCPVCGPYEKFLRVRELRDYDIHDHEEGFIGSCVAPLQIVPPNVESQYWSRRVGDTNEFHVPNVDRIYEYEDRDVPLPRVKRSGPGVWRDRSEYKRYLKEHGFKEG